MRVTDVSVTIVEVPQTAPLAWDELMHDPKYQRALERLP